MEDKEMSAAKRKMTAKEVVFELLIESKGNWDDCYEMIHKRVKIQKEDVYAFEEICDRYGIQWISIVDKDYPIKYKNNYQKPPFIVFIDKKGIERDYNYVLKYLCSEILSNHTKEKGANIWH